MGGELVHARADPRVAIECTHADAHLLRLLGIRGVQLAPALAAVRLLPTVYRLPGREQLRSFHDPKRPGNHRPCNRESGARAALTAHAVTEERTLEGGS
jgi:hypothetical protein